MRQALLCVALLMVRLLWGEHIQIIVLLIIMLLEYICLV
jgi:hypothetical protein